MLLPHIGLLPLGTYCFRKAITCVSAAASSTVEARTRSVRPLLPCVPLFQLSMPSSTASLWCTANTGPSTRTRDLRVGHDDGDLDDAVAVRAAGRSFPGRSRPGCARWGSNRCRSWCLARVKAPDSGPSLHSRPMHPTSFTLAFAAALLLSLAVKFWLTTRQMRHVAAHRDQVPAAFRRHGDAAGAPQGRRLHAGQGPLRAAGHRLRRRRAAGLDAARRPGRAERGCCATPLRPACGDMAYQLALLAAFAAHRRPARPAAGVVRHLPHRAALRLQPHDAEAVAGRHGQGHGWSARSSACRWPRSSCGSWVPRAACGGCGPGCAWVAFNLIAAGALPDRHRAALQQVRAAGRRCAEDPRAGA